MSPTSLPVTGASVKPFAVFIGAAGLRHERMRRMARAVKRVFLLGIVAGLGYAVWRAMQARLPKSANEVDWAAAPFPFPPAPRPTGVVGAHEAPEPVAEAFVEAVDGACPATHPVKAKLSSGIFHVPGGQNYERTHADRCYVDAEAAKADGLRQSQR
jgi:hypothetical protein